MLSHVVLLKPRADLTAADRSLFAEAFERAVSEIPTVRNVRIGRRAIHGAGYEATAPDAADYVAIVEFDDVDGLHVYLHHESHAELGRLFGTMLSAAIVFDFEMGGMELLQSLV